MKYYKHHYVLKEETYPYTQTQGTCLYEKKTKDTNIKVIGLNYYYENSDFLYVY